MRGLLVEDDPSLGAFVNLGLQQEGFHVDWVLDGDAADRALAARTYDVVVLDLGLPGVDGEVLLEKWRDRAKRTPVIVTTARGMLDDRVRLLNLGADDCLIKPFDLLELCARMRAVVRRSAAQDDEVLEFGPVRLLPLARIALLRGQRVDLTDREFRLLQALVCSGGRTVSREELAQLGGADARDASSNAVEVHMHNLRRKLARGVIETVRGKGYRLALPPDRRLAADAVPDAS